MRIYDLVQGPLCVSARDGDRVCDRIIPLLRQGRKVVLSFDQIETVIAAFLNAAIGRLYGEFQGEDIRKLLSVEEMQPEDLQTLKLVVENAKAYFKQRGASAEAGDVRLRS
ncbi:MAG: STAS-like domain-containing protein [Nitrospirae bacterium]|nr:STAS-like domain-containing protein [Nitrospirota bacterium]